MDTTTTKEQVTSVITSAELLKHWQGHRRLTRRLIEAFPEKEFFEYSIGGMRPFAGMVKEFLAIAVPGIREIVGGKAEQLNEQNDKADSKENVLALWDEATEELDRYWSQIPEEKFHENILSLWTISGNSVVFYLLLYRQ
ncbi:MAG: DinB family protein [Segetibacter sp.]